MFERIKDCLCHPRYLGKYNKDNIGTVILTVFLFFVLAIGMLAGRTYLEKPLDEDFGLEIASKIITGKEMNVSYDASTHSIIGDSNTINGTTYKIFILCDMEEQKNNLTEYNIFLNSTEAVVYAKTKKISSVSYEKIKVDSFQFSDIQKNDSKSIYYFRIFISQVFDSANVFFQTLGFINGIVELCIGFVLCLFFSFFLSILINPTIDKGVRIRLCFYDCCIYLVASFFAFLFNVSFISYLALMLALVYTFITFKHIIKVVIRR